jgi:hypothetical protein
LYFIARRGKEIELDESTIDMYMWLDLTVLLSMNI